MLCNWTLGSEFQGHHRVLLSLTWFFDAGIVETMSNTLTRHFFQPRLTLNPRHLARKSLKQSLQFKSTMVAFIRTSAEKLDPQVLASTLPVSLEQKI